MYIKTKTYTVVGASEGHILTNGVSYGSPVALGIGDSADNWHEIPVEEYEKIMEKEMEENRMREGE